MSDTAAATETAAETGHDRNAAPGKFIWYELITPDQDCAIDFYEEVVGWKATDPGMTDTSGLPYKILEADGSAVGGVMQLSPGMRDHGVRPGWLGYIHVADADASARRIKEAGGTVHMEPADIPGVGRFALVADPGGAPFYIMTPLPREDAPAPLAADAPGNVSWHELYAGNGEKAAFDFYRDLFGWETLQEMDMGAMGKYRIFGADGVQMGGMMDKPGNVPLAHWTFYINVEGGLDDAVERLKAKGGEVAMGPMEVPGGSWVLQGIDPRQARFALIAARR